MPAAPPRKRSSPAVGDGLEYCSDIARQSVARWLASTPRKCEAASPAINILSKRDPSCGKIAHLGKAPPLKLADLGSPRSALNILTSGPTVSAPPRAVVRLGPTSPSRETHLSRQRSIGDLLERAESAEKKLAEQSLEVQRLREELTARDTQPAQAAAREPHADRADVLQVHAVEAPGKEMPFRTPEGELYRVVVPPGISRGDSFRLRVPRRSANAQASEPAAAAAAASATVAAAADKRGIMREPEAIPSTSDGDAQRPTDGIGTPPATPPASPPVTMACSQPLPSPPLPSLPALAPAETPSTSTEATVRLRQQSALQRDRELSECTRAAIVEMERLKQVMIEVKAAEWESIQKAQEEEWARTEAAQAVEWRRVQAARAIESGRNPPHCTACGLFTVMADKDGTCYSCRSCKSSAPRLCVVAASG